MSLSPNVITKAYIRRYGDTGQTKAYVEWEGGARTEGEAKRKGRCYVLGTHMQALFERAARDGLKIGFERW